MAIKDEQGKPKYDVRPKRRTGGRKRLAADSGMDPGQLSRLLSAERMPDGRFLVGLAEALGTTVNTLFVESGIQPEENAPQTARESVPSPEPTPEAVADAWGLDRAAVRAMFLQLRKDAPASDGQAGSAEAQG